ncbi:MAG: DNA polymerase I [Candidatus Omnitrophica bacterium]|nr:DNA polymerase I [Candidatus Omnitrophota bacterium]
MSEAFLVDGSSIFFRAFHAIRELRRSDGLATNALYGYISTLRSIMKEYNPTDMAVAFDLPEPTFRHKRYESYKGNRAAPPEELVDQIPLIKSVTEKMGIPQIEKAGYEADDLLGAMARRLAAAGGSVMLVSGDKDLFQLVSPSIRMLRLNPAGKNKIYGEAEVEERYGVPPSRIVDVFALMGDSSDNIPGVPGIGEKTAVALIQQYGSIESIYEHLDEIKGKKRQENLRENRDMAFLSRELILLATDLDLEWPDEFTRLRSVNVEELRRFFEEMEFRTFAADLPRGDSPEAGPSSSLEIHYQTVASIEDLRGLIENVKKKGACAVDTETTSLDALGARLVGVSISIEDGQGWYIPLGHHQGDNLPREQALALLREILESESIAKTGHNLKYDLHVLANEGVYLRGELDDTLIASYLSQPQRESRKLDDLAFKELGMEMTPISDLIGTGRNQKSMADVAIEQASPYACEDTDAAWRLKNLLIPKVNDLKMKFLYRQVEMPLLEVLAAMERKGIRVDPSALDRQSRELSGEMEALEQEIFQSVGREFNLNSPSQLAEILYDDLKILRGRKRSTRAGILENLAKEGAPIARQILDYRHRKKIQSTYLDALPKLIRPETGRVHTTYNQAVVNTGRISSTDPNLQNIPIRTDLGRRVRSAFISSEGFVLASLDYSQIELRILAHVSRDPGLRRAFSAGEDIHARTAAEVFGAALESVTPEMRRKAKEINFGLNYGMSPFGLAQRLGIENEEAASYIQTYFARYPLVQTYMDETTIFARDNLYVTTVLNRRIPAPGIRDSNRMRRENAQRAAINAPIQGSAADLMKKAMVDVSDELKKDADKASILLTVHDELVLEIREDAVDEICARCRRRMEDALEFSIPIPVEIAVGPSWADLK